jgi:hypothetical protein
MANDFASALTATAGRLGISPVDLGTVISYETGGTFDPWQRGPTTKWGTHRGLIQFGEPQQQKYGVHQGQSATDQLGSVAKYLQDTGVKPGMGLLDIYSAINAGAPGRYNASDTAAGGAPGTVRDKVENQMGAHRAKAESLLAGMFAPGGATAAPTGAGQKPLAGTSLAEALPGATLPGGAVAIPVEAPPDPMAVAAAGIAQQFQQRDAEEKRTAEARRMALFSAPGGLGGLYG